LKPFIKSFKSLDLATYPVFLCSTISGTHQVLKVTIGHPQDKLSATTKPKLSINVGYKNISLELKYVATFS
jgi:hypothetical protein